MADRKNDAPKRPRGRPVTTGGVRKNVMLDEESLKIAQQLGGGNVSEGIRVALQAMKTKGPA